MAKKQFKEQINGYNKGQVDRYIRELQKAYQTVYMAYLELHDSHYEKIKKIHYNSHFDKPSNRLLKTSE